MNTPPNTPPLTAKQVVDAYFLEHRSKLIDLAAFLDRVDHAPPGPPGSSDPPGGGGGGTTEPDHRLVALRDAIPMLLDAKPSRAKRILERLSDPTDTPTPTPGPPATGAPPHPPLSTHTGQQK